MGIIRDTNEDNKKNRIGELSDSVQKGDFQLVSPQPQIPVSPTSDATVPVTPEMEVEQQANQEAVSGSLEVMPDAVEQSVEELADPNAGLEPSEPEQMPFGATATKEQTQQDAENVPNVLDSFPTLNEAAQGLGSQVGSFTDPSSGMPMMETIPVRYEIFDTQKALREDAAARQFIRYRTPQEVKTDLRDWAMRMMQSPALVSPGQPNLNSRRNILESSGVMGLLGRLYNFVTDNDASDFDKKSTYINPVAGYQGFIEQFNQDAEEKGLLGAVGGAVTSLIPRAMAGQWGEFGTGVLPGIFYALSLPQNIVVGGITDVHNLMTGNSDPKSDLPNFLQAAINGKDLSFSERTSASKPLSVRGGNSGGEIETITELKNRSWIYNANPIITPLLAAGDKIRDIVVGEDRDTLPAIPESYANAFEFITGLTLDVVTDPASIFATGRNVVKVLDDVPVNQIISTPGGALDLPTPQARQGLPPGQTSPPSGLASPVTPSVVPDVLGGDVVDQGARRGLNDVTIDVEGRPVVEPPPTPQPTLGGENVQAVTPDILGGEIVQQGARQGLGDTTVDIPTQPFDDAIIKRSERDLLPGNPEVKSDEFIGYLLSNEKASPAQLEEAIGRSLTPPSLLAPPTQPVAGLLPPAVKPDILPGTTTDTYMKYISDTFSVESNNALRSQSLLRPLQRRTNQELTELAKAQGLVLDESTDIVSMRRLAIASGQDASVRYQPALPYAPEVPRLPGVNAYLDNLANSVIDSPTLSTTIDAYQRLILPSDLVAKSDEGMQLTAELLRNRQVFESVGNESAYLSSVYDAQKTQMADNLVFLDDLPDVGRRSVDESILDDFDDEDFLDALDESTFLDDALDELEGRPAPTVESTFDFLDESETFADEEYTQMMRQLQEARSRNEEGGLKLKPRGSNEVIRVHPRGIEETADGRFYAQTADFILGEDGEFKIPGITDEKLGIIYSGDKLALSLDAFGNEYIEVSFEVNGATQRQYAQTPLVEVISELKEASKAFKEHLQNPANYHIYSTHADSADDAEYFMKIKTYIRQGFNVYDFSEVPVNSKYDFYSFSPEELESYRVKDKSPKELANFLIDNINAALLLDNRQGLQGKMPKPELVKRYYHGTKVQGLDLTKADPLIGASRSEIGTVLHFADDSNVGNLYADAIPSRNQIPGKELAEEGHLFETVIEPANSLNPNEAIPEAARSMIKKIAEGLVDDKLAKRIDKLSKRNDISLVEFYDKVNDLLKENFPEFPEEIATQIQRRVSTALKTAGYDSIAADSKHIGVLDPAIIKQVNEVQRPPSSFADMPKDPNIKAAYSKYVGDELTASLYPKSKFAEVVSAESRINYEKEVLVDTAQRVEQADNVSRTMAVELVQQERELRKAALDETILDEARKTQRYDAQNQTQIEHMSSPERGIC